MNETDLLSIRDMMRKFDIDIFAMMLIPNDDSNFHEFLTDDARVDMIIGKERYFIISENNTGLKYVLITDAELNYVAHHCFNSLLSSDRFNANVIHASRVFDDSSLPINNPPIITGTKTCLRDDPEVLLVKFEDRSFTQKCRSVIRIILSKGDSTQFVASLKSKSISYQNLPVESVKLHEFFMIDGDEDSRFTIECGYHNDAVHMFLVKNDNIRRSVSINDLISDSHEIDMINRLLKTILIYTKE